MNLFHAIESELPQVEKPGLGDVILIKHLKINIFNSTRQAVSTPRTIHVMVRRGEKADSFKQHWISDNDRRVIGLMQRWWDAKESKEGSIRVIPGYGRPLIEVHALTDSIKYFDIVLQVITKAEQHHANRMNAYLTDYTVNPQPPMRFLETGMAGVVDTHLVIQGWFWDNQMSLISQVQSGEVIKVRNAVRILSPSNELEFNVHGSSDAKPNIQRLPIDGAEARSLLRRKDAYEQHKQSLGSQSSQMPQKTSYPPIQQQQQEPYYHQQQQQQQGIVPQQQGIVPQQQGIVPQQQFNQQFNQPTGMSTNPMMSPSNWQAGPAPDLVNDMMDTDNIATGLYNTFSVEFPRTPQF
jgi:hypothetical protein